MALRLTLWNVQMKEEKKTEKSNNKTHKKIEHGGEEVYAHGYYHRKVSAMGKDGARKRLKIKVKRYKCLSCGRTYTQNCKHIGLQKNQRRNWQFTAPFGLQLRQMAF